MKIGVISDTHIPVAAAQIPQAVLDAFKNADMIIHAGDLVDPKVAEKLKSICPNVKLVRGNMDCGALKNTLPEKEILKIGRFKIGLAHGFGAPNKLIDALSEIFKNDGVDMVIFGHSHTPFNEKKNGILFFNPGSPTDKAFAPYNSFGIIEINDKIEARIVKL